MEWNPNHNRIARLDGLRGIAILLVIYWHYIANFIPSDGFLGVVRKLSYLSWSGVDLFFVLSGFLIGSILLDNKDSKNYFAAFYVRRICRIFPIYYLMVILFLIISSGGLFSQTNLSSLFYYSPLPLVGYFTHTQNIFMIAYQSFGPKWLDVTWSLAIEEQFYLILAPAIRFIPQRLLLSVCFAGLIIPAFFRIVAINTPSIQLALYISLPARADCLLMGVLIAITMRHENIRDFIYKNLNTISIAFFTLLFALVITCLQLSTNPLLTHHITVFLSFLALFYGISLTICLLSDNRTLIGILENRYIGRMGWISYGAYLFHNPILRIVHYYLYDQQPKLESLADLFASFLAFLITCGVSWISFNFFEKRIIALGKRCKYRPAQRGQT